jgi:hypothetical protein
VANIKKGDTWPPQRGAATDDDGLLPLVEADEVLFFASKSNPTNFIQGTATVIDPPDADGFNWQYEWQAGQTDVPGSYKCELQITWDAGSSPPKVETVPNDGSANPDLVIWEDLD